MEGLIIQNNHETNSIEIQEGSIFKDSLIKIEGSNNNVTLKKCLEYSKLTIKIKGNNKTILINESSKKINNLTISSHRGDNQSVIIGKDFGCGGSILHLNDGDESITIGEDCLFSWDIHMRTSDGHSIIDQSTGIAFNTPKPIKIGNRVWVSQHVYIMKGSEIQDDSVIALGSIVTKHFDESNVVIAGNPSKIIRRNIRWNRKKPSEFNSDR